jgi:hypothetical protein
MTIPSLPVAATLRFHTRRATCAPCPGARNRGGCTRCPPIPRRYPCPADADAAVSAASFFALGTNFVNQPKPLISKVEATSGIEPEYTVLQTVA